MLILSRVVIKLMYWFKGVLVVVKILNLKYVVLCYLFNIEYKLM